MKKLILLFLLVPSLFFAQQDCRYTYDAEVLSCYDADTCDFNIDVGFGIKIKRKIRFYGVNTWELRGENKVLGIIARDTVRNLIVGENITLQTLKDRTGKYGRILGIIYVDIDKDGINDNLNLWLIENNHGVEYLKN